MKETGKEKFEDILRCVSFVKPSGAPVRMDVSYIPEGEDRSIHTVFHFVPNVFTLPSRTFHGLCLLSPALTEARFPENTTSLQASRAPAQLSYRRFGGKADILLVTDSLFTPEDKPAFLRDSGHLAISPSSPPSHCPLASQLLPLLTEDFST